MADNDLTTLFNTKQYLGLDADTVNVKADAILRRLISAASVFILNQIQRQSLAVATYTERYSAPRTNSLLLRNSPVISVSSIFAEGQIITAQAAINPRARGYFLDNPVSRRGSVSLEGYGWGRGQNSIEVTYRAGWLTAEAILIPGDPYQIQTQRVWTSDEGVTMGGVAMARVDGEPLAGEYAVDGGFYTFNAADAAQRAVISYGYVPADLEQAVLELVGLRYNERDRLGYVSKSLGGQETVTFSQKDMAASTRTALSSYIPVAPL
jgi:hypothetical protein